METIPRILQRGFTFRYQDRLYHIVLAFQDGEDEETMYVVKYYGRYKKWWHYTIMSDFLVKDIIAKKTK